MVSSLQETEYESKPSKKKMAVGKDTTETQSARSTEMEDNSPRKARAKKKISTSWASPLDAVVAKGPSTPSTPAANNGDVSKKGKKAIPRSPLGKVPDLELVHQPPSSAQEEKNSSAAKKSTQDPSQKEDVKRKETTQSEKEDTTKSPKKSSKRKKKKKLDDSSDSTPPVSKSSLSTASSFDLDAENALKWLRKEEGYEDVQDAASFKKLDKFIQKTGRSLEERAEEMSSALKFLRKNQVAASSKDGKDTERPKGTADTGSSRDQEPLDRENDDTLTNPPAGKKNTKKDTNILSSKSPRGSRKAVTDLNLESEDSHKDVASADKQERPVRTAHAEQTSSPRNVEATRRRASKSPRRGKRKTDKHSSPQNNSDGKESKASKSVKSPKGRKSKLRNSKSSLDSEMSPKPEPAKKEPSSKKSKSPRARESAKPTSSDIRLLDLEPPLGTTKSPKKGDAGLSKRDSRKKPQVVDAPKNLSKSVAENEVSESQMEATENGLGTSLPNPPFSESVDVAKTEAIPGHNGADDKTSQSKRDTRGRLVGLDPPKFFGKPVPDNKANESPMDATTDDAVSTLPEPPSESSVVANAEENEGQAGRDDNPGISAVESRKSLVGLDPPKFLGKSVPDKKVNESPMDATSNNAATSLPESPLESVSTEAARGHNGADEKTSHSKSETRKRLGGLAPPMFLGKPVPDNKAKESPMDATKNNAGTSLPESPLKSVGTEAARGHNGADEKTSQSKSETRKRLGGLDPPKFLGKPVPDNKVNESPMDATNNNTGTSLPESPLKSVGTEAARGNNDADEKTSESKRETRKRLGGLDPPKFLGKPVPDNEVNESPMDATSDDAGGSLPEQPSKSVGMASTESTETQEGGGDRSKLAETLDIVPPLAQDGSSCAQGASGVPAPTTPDELNALGEASEGSNPTKLEQLARSGGTLSQEGFSNSERLPREDEQKSVSPKASTAAMVMDEGSAQVADNRLLRRSYSSPYKSAASQTTFSQLKLREARPSVLAKPESVTSSVTRPKLRKSLSPVSKMKPVVPVPWSNRKLKDTTNSEQSTSSASDEPTKLRSAQTSANVSQGAINTLVQSPDDSLQKGEPETQEPDSLGPESNFPRTPSLDEAPIPDETEDSGPGNEKTPAILENVSNLVTEPDTEPAADKTGALCAPSTPRKSDGAAIGDSNKDGPSTPPPHISQSNRSGSFGARKSMFEHQNSDVPEWARSPGAGVASTPLRRATRGRVSASASNMTVSAIATPGRRKRRTVLEATGSTAHSPHSPGLGLTPLDVEAPRRSSRSPNPPKRFFDKVHSKDNVQSYVDSAVGMLEDPSKKSHVEALVLKIDIMGGFPKTRRLSMRDNELVSQLIMATRNDPSITSIEVDAAAFGTVNTTLLYQFIDSLRLNLHLKSISFKGLEMGNDFLYALAASMESNFVLEEIDLSDNCFTNEGLAAFCQDLATTNQTCRSVKLGNQKRPISAASEEDVLDAFRQNVALTSVELDFQSDEGPAKLAEILVRNQKDQGKFNVDKDAKLLSVLKYEAERAKELWANTKEEIGSPKAEDHDWDYLYELALLFDKHKLKKEVQDDTADHVPGAERRNGDMMTKEEKKEFLFGEFKTLLAESVSCFNSDGSFLTNEFIAGYFKENPEEDALDFDFHGQWKLFKRFPPHDPARQLIVSKFVDALVTHRRAHELTGINMANTGCGDDFLVALSKRLVEDDALLPRLHTLNFETNYINEIGVVALANLIASPSSCKYMQVIRLENQKGLLKSKGEFALAKALRTNRSIVVLSLRIRNLLEKQQIGKYIFRNVDFLRQARQRYMKATGTQRERNRVEQFFDQVKANDESITEVDMVGNTRFLSLTAEEKQYAASSLARNTNVLTLTLNGCGIDDDFAIALGEAFKTNFAIEKVNLESNQISGTGIKALFEGLGENSTIEELNLHNQSKMTASADEDLLADFLEENTTLTKLGIDLRSKMAQIKLDRKTSHNKNNELKRRAEAKGDGYAFHESFTMLKF